MRGELERLRAVTEIQNIMGRYETLLAPQTMDRVAPEIFALWIDDTKIIYDRLLETLDIAEKENITSQ